MEIEIETVKLDPKAVKPLRIHRPENLEEPNPEKYRSTHMIPYVESPHQAWTPIKVLDFLDGKKWGQVALAYVSALNPSAIRVTTGMMTLDSRTGRVTVVVDENDIIKGIEMECKVSLPEGIAHGEALSMALEYGIDSEQVKWYNDDNIQYYSHGFDGYEKVLNDGTRVPFPKLPENHMSIITEDQIYECARLCHEANRAYCKMIGDHSQVAWEDCPQWQKDSAVNGVKHAIKNPDATPASMHENWMKEKLADGWKFGEVKDPEKKEHPCMVEYEKLPQSQQVKDYIFLCTVRANCK